jgi:hypothetical protein
MIIEKFAAEHEALSSLIKNSPNNIPRSLDPSIEETFQPKQRKARKETLR